MIMTTAAEIEIALYHARCHHNMMSMNSAHSHPQGVSSRPGEGGEESSMSRRHRDTHSGGSIGSRRYHASETDDAPILFCTGTDDNSETNSPTKIFSHPPLGNNKYDSSDEYRDAESTSSDNKLLEIDRRRRRIQMEAQLMNDCWEANLPDEGISHEAKDDIQLNQQRGEQDLLDEMLPKMDLQITSSTSSSDIKPSTTTSSNESVMSLPEQILQQRLQRKPQLSLHKHNHGQFVRYDSRSPEQRRKALHATITGYTCDAPLPLGSPPFAEEDQEFENDNASTVASSNGATSNVFSDLRRKLKLHENGHQLDADDQQDSSSPLASLPQRPICRFPEEADRKRIIGCLAIVLASSYAYETAPHLLVKEEANDMSSRVDGSDVEGSVTSTVPSDKFAQQHDIDTNGDTDCIGDLVSEEESCRTSSHPHLQQHKKQQHLIEQSRKQKNKSTNHAAKKPPPASNSFSFNTNAASRIFDKVGSQNPPPSLTTELAEIRHRIRRHAILSELLISSAELLLLDPSHAKAFLPMLDGLLTNVASSNSTDRCCHESVHFDGTNKQSWKGRGFGGGGFAVAANIGDEEISVPSSRPTTSISDIPPRMTQPTLSTSLSSTSDVVIGGSSTDALPKQSSTNSIEGGRGLENFDELDPSSSRVKLSAKAQDNNNPNRPATAYAPLDTVIIEGDLAAPFLQTLTPGAGFRCIALLLLNHLLRDGRGYDARVRHAFKRLAVIVISHELKVGGILCLDLDDEEDLDALLWGDMKTQPGENESLHDADELALLATRKFEALEHAIAARLISLSVDNDAGTQTAKARSNDHKQSPRVRRAASSASSLSSSTHGRIALAPKETPSPSQYGMSREQILRGIKVGTAGAVGATLFALTGGLAAPGIAAGLAAVVGTSAIAAGVSTALTSAAAITTIFGVGGAGLASYKMHRRTKGLTEFNFNKEEVGGKDSDAELFSTVCISGWLRDTRDFQRPWGVSPSHPRIVDKQELLERFYFVHNPDNVFRVGEILKHWKGRYFQLWRALGQKYGRDPSNLFPLTVGPRISAELTHEEVEAVDYLLGELGYTHHKKTANEPSMFGAKPDLTINDESKKPRGSPPAEAKKLHSAQQILKESSMRPKKWLPNGSDIASSLSLFSESETNSMHDNSTHSATSASSIGFKPAAEQGASPPPKHLLTVWDYHANYGGELYTVQWESELLMELCDSVTDQMIEWGISATRTILHTTVFATLMTAVTIPYSLVLAANTIDSSWTMAMERADRAGIELAKSLIDSIAGHRPVVLVGFSMGARVIYSCLKELAKHQEIWEAHQQRKRLPVNSRRKSSNRQREDSGEDNLRYVREPASIIEDAILMGTPNHVSIQGWEACRRVVAGRMINCYSRKDYILSLMFQLKRFQGILRPVCGTSPVAVNGVENYDVTELVSTHTDYCLVSGEILKRIRHGQPQRASELMTEVSAMVTTIKITDREIDGLPISQTKC